MKISNLWLFLVLCHCQPPQFGSGFSMVNPDVVDLNQFPDIPKVEWRYSTLEPGDCIYIPSGTFQCTDLYWLQNRMAFFVLARFQVIFIFLTTTNELWSHQLDNLILTATFIQSVTTTTDKKVSGDLPLTNHSTWLLLLLLLLLLLF